MNNSDKKYLKYKMKYKKEKQNKNNMIGGVPDNPSKLYNKLVEFKDVTKILNYNTYFFDMDGVIKGIGESNFLGAIKFINLLLAIGKRVVFITNNPIKTRKDFLIEIFELWMPYQNTDGYINFNFENNPTFLELYWKYIISNEKSYLDESKFTRKGLDESYTGSDSLLVINELDDTTNETNNKFKEAIIKIHMRERNYLKLFYGKEYFLGFSDFINYLYNCKLDKFLDFFYNYIICISNLTTDFIEKKNIERKTKELSKCTTLIYSDQYEDKSLDARLFCDICDILDNSPYDKSIYQEFKNYNIKHTEQLEAYFINFGSEFDKMNTSPTEPDNSLSSNVPLYLSKENIEFLDSINTLIIGYDPKINATKALMIADIIFYKISKNSDFNVYVLGTDKSGATGYLLRNMSMQHLKARGIGAGSIGRWILEIANVPIIPEYLGKPSTHIINYMRDVKHKYIDDEQTSKYLMIGDTMETDIKFGNELGINTLLVLSGSTTRELLKFSDFLSLIQHLINTHTENIIDVTLTIIDYGISFTNNKKITFDDALNILPSSICMLFKACLEAGSDSIKKAKRINLVDFINKFKDYDYQLNKCNPDYIFESLKALYELIK